MSTEQRSSGNDSVARSGGSGSAGGLRTMFDRFRSSKNRTQQTTPEKKRQSMAASDLRVEQDAKARTVRPHHRDRRHERDGDTTKTEAPIPESAGAPKDRSSPGFFSKILRRQTPSKQGIERPRILHLQDGSLQDEAIWSIDENRMPRERRIPKPCQNGTPPSCRVGYSRVDVKINTGENKRCSQVYVPTHAATDFVRVPVDRSLKDRYSTVVDEEAGHRLSQMLAQLSPMREIDSNSPASFMSDTYNCNTQRRLTEATLGGASDVGTESSFGNDGGVGVNTLQPPPIPSRDFRRRSRLSYVAAEDRGQIAEEPTRGSDEYQEFLQRAQARERREQDAIWWASGDRSEKRSVTPVRQEMANECNLNRSGTFGGTRRDRSHSRQRDDGRKRSSCHSGQLRDSRKRRSYAGGEFKLDTAFDPPSTNLRKKTSAAKRLSDYFKPPRDAVAAAAYEQPDSKRLSRATYR